MKINERYSIYHLLLMVRSNK